MKNSLIVAGVVCLLSLLTWLALQGMSADAQVAQTALRQLDIFAATESTLHRDLLRARVGLLRNYDPLNNEVDALQKAVANLRVALPTDPEYAAAVDHLADMVGQQERWTEQFKSRNALLQNSLSYFNVFSARLRETSRDRELIEQTSAVATALLRMVSDSSPEALATFDDRLKELSVDELSPADAELAQSLIAHARLLRVVLPATHQVLQSIFTIPSKLEQDRLRNMIMAREAESEACALVFRRILYGASLVLAGLVVLLAVRLRSRARTLQHIARIEHVIADISTRFINPHTDQIGNDITSALEKLANCIGADRAYFALSSSGCSYRWARPGVDWPQDWPERALASIALLDHVDDDIIFMPQVDPSVAHGIVGLPPDLRSWLCIPRREGSTVGCVLTGVLGFDAVTTEMSMARTECGLFRMPADALANAVERESLVRERQRLDETLQQTRRLDTIGAFASGIAHNFNNIVGAILGYTEMAQTQLEDGKVPSSHLLEIRRAGERARDLVEQILKFGRQTAIDQEAISLTNLLRETASLLSASLPPDISLEVEPGEEDIALQGRPEQLQQVIMNVCNNAAQAIDGAGSISIALQRQVIAVSMHLDHGIILPGEYAVISVADTGCGMDETTRKQIFEPFFTTRPDGNGLGLATAHAIARDHGGGMSVESSVGKGTRFQIWLPCAKRAVLPFAGAARKTPPAGGETILILECDQARLLRHEEIIAALGYEPIGFVDAADAIKALRAKPDRFDAAVVCHLHGITAALDFTREMARIAPFVPIILTTASAGDLGGDMLATAGISEVVRHPLRSGEISGALARCLASSPRRWGMAVV